MKNHPAMKIAASLAVLVLGLTLSAVVQGQSEPTLDQLLAERQAGPQPYLLNDWEREFVRTEAELYQAPEAETLEAEDGLQLAYREWVPKEWNGAGEIYLIVPGSPAISASRTRSVSIWAAPPPTSA